MRSLAVPTLLLPLLTSCATGGGFVSSLDDLTADVDVEGIIDLEQARSISLNGLAPNEGAGTAVRFKASRSPFTSIGISNVDFDRPCLTSEDDDFEADSYVVRRTIGKGIKPQKLLDVRNDLLQVRLLASELIRDIAEEAAARALLAGADDAGRSKANEAFETARDAVKQSREDFDKAYNEAIEHLDTPGMIIVRVEQKKDVSWAVALGEILGLSGERALESAGFAVLGGLRFEQLYVGRDIAHMVGSTNRGWKLFGNDFPIVLGLWDLPKDSWFWWVPVPIPIIGQVAYDDVWVVTSALKAEQVLYAQDQLTQSKIEANLEASYEQLANLQETLESLDKIKVEAVFQAIENLGNAGVTGAATEEVISLRKLRGDLIDGVDQDPKSEAAWQTVYQVGADLSDLRKFVGEGGVRFDFGLFDWIARLGNQ